MKQKTLLSLAFMLLVTGACATSDPVLRGEYENASTMTQTDHASSTGSTYQSSDSTPAYASVSTAEQTTQTTQVAPPRLSRTQRALEVLRRSPLGRFGRFITGRRLGPANPTPATATTAAAPVATTGSPRVVVGQPVDTGSGVRSSVTGNPVGQVPGLTPPAATTSAPATAQTTLPSPTAVPVGPAPPASGRLIVGQPVDSGSGIRSTVTGYPVEPIPGVTPATNQLQPSLASPSEAALANADTAGRAAAASSPPPTTVTVTTPPVAAIAPAEPAPGTTVANTKASSAAVKIETSPDGTAVVTNVGEEEQPKPAAKKKPVAKKKN